MDKINFKLLADVNRKDKKLSENKPDKTALNVKTTTNLAGIGASAFIADKFTKKFVLTAQEKGGLATYAKHKKQNIYKALKSIPESIKNNVDDILTNSKLYSQTIKPQAKKAASSVSRFFAKHTKLTKVLTAPGKLVKNLADKSLTWALKLPKSVKIASAIAAVIVAIKHIHKSGEIDGKHKAMNTMAKTENFLRLS